MKQVYKKKPEYLDVVFVADDSQSIKDVFEIAGVSSAPITFDENGSRVINLDGDQKIAINNVVFKDKKSGKLVIMPQEKLLQFYDLYNDEVVAPEEGNKSE